jgi:hypothetical protein
MSAGPERCRANVGSEILVSPTFQCARRLLGWSLTYRLPES